MPGGAQCIANLVVTQKRLETNAKKAVKDWGKGTIKESKEKFCPRKTGKLASTGKVEVTLNTLTEFFIRLSYNTPYALKQHEMAWYRHPVGQWRYLATPVINRSLLLLKMVEDSWRAEL